MKKLLKTKNILAALSLSVWCVAPQVYASGPKPVPLDGIAYEVGKTMRDNLRGLLGQRVTVRLRGASVVTGRVKAVGDQLLHLEGLDQKEFFDALVSIPEIVAIEARFRQYAR